MLLFMLRSSPVQSDMSTLLDILDRLLPQLSSTQPYNRISLCHSDTYGCVDDDCGNKRSNYVSLSLLCHCYCTLSVRFIKFQFTAGELLASRSSIFLFTYPWLSLYRKQTYFPHSFLSLIGNSRESIISSQCYAPNGAVERTLLGAQ